MFLGDKEILKNKYFPVLDYGFVALKDYMGSDEAIEEAARVSYGKGTRKKSDTHNLIRYLMRHGHTSPFEMAECKFHVRVPMDCWRQWIRHRTASVNEYSTRYSEAINLKQCTNKDQWRLQSTSNKQGGSKLLVEEDGGAYCGKVLTDEEIYLHALSNRVYEHRLESGISREQARKDLPLSTYTEAYWKIDLHNLFHFLKLRCDSHAQLEIRQYAYIIGGIVKELFPISFEAWYDYVFEARTFSRLEVLLWHKLEYYKHYENCYIDELDKDIIYEAAQELNMSKREVREFLTKFEFNPRSFELDIDSSYNADYFQKMKEQDEKTNSVGKSTSGA